ncbi:MAG: MtaA/CmuA family methyltransferase [Candidatus Marinimicrobia bacterium]|nr:MtaA/CmuA family methyltransferase [Candidatus Neomarinimicrobiota bacterium]
MSRELFLDAVRGQPTPRPAFGSGTSIVTEELMDLVGAAFPDAHLNADAMTKLAMAGHTVYGFDVVMPLFSVWHESAAVGCPVEWGTKGRMPDCRGHIWETADDIRYTKDFLKHPAAQTPLKSLAMLKSALGADSAVCGKVFGPWTLGYHFFGVENWLVNAALEPDMIKACIEQLKNLTLWFAAAQLEAGADCLLLADHATRDLCGPAMYEEFLLPVHAELAQAIDCPLILHICGDTKDRMEYIRQTGLDCFHWDTKSGTSAEIRSLAGQQLSLMGGISNVAVLNNGTEADVIRQAQAAAEAGINIIGPECAVPLGVRVNNLKAVTRMDAWAASRN